MNNQKVALIYDFDSTLSLRDMQDDYFSPALGLTAEEFWGRSGDTAANNEADGILSAMLLMVDEMKKAKIPMTRRYLEHCGKAVELFPGVVEWFSRINAYGASLGLVVEHYIISAGMTDIIRGTAIAHEFKQIFACEFLYNEEGIAYWPAQLVNAAVKPHYLYRINKGLIRIGEERLVNYPMPEDEKAIPFTNMIYIGDGLTDVPAMSLLRRNGGHALIVYTDEAYGKAFVEEGRADGAYPADYRKDSRMDQKVAELLKEIAGE